MPTFLLIRYCFAVQGALYSGSAQARRKKIFEKLSSQRSAISSQPKWVRLRLFWIVRLPALPLPFDCAQGSGLRPSARHDDKLMRGEFPPLQAKIGLA
jgi:hypothetical protein